MHTLKPRAADGKKKQQQLIHPKHSRKNTKKAKKNKKRQEKYKTNNRRAELKVNHTII